MTGIRVLHCPHLVGGQSQQLARSERELGLESWCVSFARTIFDYPCDEILWNDPRTVVANEFKRLALLRRALRDFDVIHFNFGSPILPKPVDAQPRPGSQARGTLRWAYNLYASLVEFRDLALLHRAGKAIFVSYQGDDARQGDYCLQHFPVSAAAEVEPGYYTPESDARKRREIAEFGRYAHGIFALNPDLLHVLPPRARFLPYAHLDLRDWTPVPHPGSRVPLVVHAPSHRGVKGTRHVVAAVERLKAEGVALDFMLIEGLPQREARRLYEKADLLVDQLLVGWYGGLAVELMALGKPVICYLRESDLAFIPTAMRAELPVINADPASIYSVLKDWLTAQRHLLPELGRRGRAYAEKWHDPLSVAGHLKAHYLSALSAAGNRGARDD